MHFRALTFSAAAFGAFCVLALALSIPSGAMLNFVSGIWISLGVDLHKGILYRPLIGENGFGGTRYFPLWILLHASLMRLGLSPVGAGHVISVAAALGWIGGTYRLMRELLFPSALARALSLLTLCTSAGILGFTTVRGDVLAAALNVWGVLYSTRAFHPQRNASALTVAGGLFSAAICAKVSAGFGVLAMAVALALNGFPKRAAALATGTVATTSVALLIANAASSGRMFETMRACATAGGSLWTYIHAPLSFAYTLVHQDPMTVVITTLFVAGLVAIPWRAWKEIPTFLAIGGVTMIVALNASPGIDYNHFLDVLGFALIFVGHQINHRRLDPSLATWALSIAGVLSMVLFFYTIREARRYPAPQMRAVRAYLSTSDIGAAPILSDNALFPAADGRPSWIIDVIMFRQLRVRDPRYARELESQVARSRFGAVVLEEDVRTEPGLAVLAYHFGDGFLPVFNRSYELVAQFPPYFVYRPRVRS